MQSCKRHFPFTDYDSYSTDHALHLHPAKRHCTEKSCSPTKYAVQMETREMTNDVAADMDCEPCMPVQNTIDVRHPQTAQYLQQNVTNSYTSNSSQITYRNNNNNNTMVDRYITPSDVCVRCQAGEAGHYGHIGR